MELILILILWNFIDLLNRFYFILFYFISLLNR